ncbi:MAG: iron-containing alcohol dehydrogenase [Coriobacteriales bacterium]|jgi:alcohol dehydrogenase
MFSNLTQLAPVVYGNGSVSVIADKIQELGGTKVMLVYDEGIKEAGTGPRVASIIREAGIDLVEIDNIITEPPDSQMEEIYAANKDRGIDLIVGLGGGSCMDAAKALSFMFANKIDSLEGYLMPGPDYPVSGIKLIEIPTTSGTGSEASLVGVIADTKNNLKGGVLSPMTLSIVDPELALTMPPYLTAITGMDAFSHCVEAMTANMHNPKSDALADYAIRQIMECLPRAVSKGTDLEAREGMAVAALFGGMAFSDSFVNFGHAMAENIGARCEADDGHIPHGLCCALCLPPTMEYVGDLCGDRIVVVANAMGIDCTGIEGDYPKIGAKAADETRRFMKQIGIPSFAEKGVSRDDIMDAVPAVAASHHCEACIAPITEDVAAKYTARAYDAYQ